MVETIESYKTLQALIASGVTDFQEYGRVNTAVHGDLIKLYYSKSAFYEGDWNWLELHSRGHIYDCKTGKLVALPFDKFFNYGEGDRYPSKQAEIVSVTEKIDGSLGIGYFYEGQWHISTRGSFDSMQALWATDFLRKHYPEIASLPPFITPLFEIVYPENYHLSDLVVDYGETEELYLIGARNCLTLADYDWDVVEELAINYGFATPCVCQFENIKELMASREMLSENEEGWVVRMSDGSRFKVKGEQYLEMHRMVSNFGEKRLFDIFSQDMEAFAQWSEIPAGEFLSGLYFQDIPNNTYPVHEKHVEEAREILREFSRQYLEITAHYYNAFRVLSHYKDRGEFARNAIKIHGSENAHFLFALRDGKLPRFVELVLNRMKLNLD